MMIGESRRPNPTVHVPPWDLIIEDPTAIISSPTYGDALTALQRYLPSNEFTADDLSDDIDFQANFPAATFSCDNFRMYEFKVRRCLRGRSHDWTECPYAHPGEKARRRDPRRYQYSGTACPEFRKGNCRKGESCEFAHGVFECWLHPTRYRTQPCKDGTGCRRRVCFFAHTPEQLRVLSPGPESYDASSPAPESYDGSPFRRAFVASPPTSPPMSPSDSLSYNSVFQPLSPTPVPESFTGSPFRRGFLSGSPESPPRDSPPMSPSDSLSYNSVREVVSCMRNLQLNKVMGFGSISPRGSMTRPGFSSLPTTPTRTVTRSGLCYLDSVWDSQSEEEPVMERVESGRDLRAKIYAKLSKENSLERVESVSQGPGQGPDVGWVSELVK